MRVQVANILTIAFNAIALIAILGSAMFAPWGTSALVILALYLIAQYFLTQYEKQVNAALDALWSAADAKGLDAGDLNKLLNYTGKVPLARTQTGNRQYYISKQQAIAFTKIIEAK